MPTAAVLTISDSRSRGAGEDASGPAVEELLVGLGLQITHRRVVADETELIRAAVREHVDHVSLIVTTGGTGIGPRDVTPEALAPLFEKRLPGFGEIMRTATFDKTPLSIISRGGAGVIGRTLVVMLPGSPKGVRDCLQIVGPAVRHVLKVLSSGPMDCQGDAGRSA